MNHDEQLGVLRAAKGDPAKLALAMVDLAHADLDESDRVRIKEALEAAAIPNWCDEAVLADLLMVSMEDATSLLVQLRHLTITERFYARGVCAIRICDWARRALRRRLGQDRFGRFNLLSKLAARHFKGKSTNCSRLETAYHLAYAEPEAGVIHLEQLYAEFSQATHCQSFYTLRQLIGELERDDAAPALSQAICAEQLATMLTHFGLTEDSISYLQRAVAKYRQVHDISRQYRCLSALATAFRAAGDQARAEAVAVEAEQVHRSLMIPFPRKGATKKLEGLGSLAPKEYKDSSPQNIESYAPSQSAQTTGEQLVKLVLEHLHLLTTSDDALTESEKNRKKWVQAIAFGLFAIGVGAALAGLLWPKSPTRKLSPDFRGKMILMLSQIARVVNTAEPNSEDVKLANRATQDVNSLLGNGLE